MADVFVARVEDIKHDNATWIVFMVEHDKQGSIAHVAKIIF